MTKHELTGIKKSEPIPIYFRIFGWIVVIVFAAFVASLPISWAIHLGWFQWLSQNEGIVNSVLTFVLVISTVITTQFTGRAVSISNQQIAVLKAQLEHEQRPSLRFNGVTGETKTWKLYNMGKYPVYLDSIYIVYSGALYMISEDSLNTNAQTFRIDSFADISLPAKPITSFKMGEQELLISFYYGGTGDTLHTFHVGFNVSTGGHVSVPEIQELLMDYNPTQHYDKFNLSY